MNIELLNHKEVDQIIDLALAEDQVQNDLTTQSCNLGDKKVRATIFAKKPTIACGGPLISKILDRAQAKDIRVSKLAEDGTELRVKAPWILLEGNAATILTLERTILNFLIRMCGIATITNDVVKTISSTSCKVLHTRKTIPGHRRTDVYSCLVGGAQPHRISLADAILVKENHWQAATDFNTIVDGITKLRSQAKFVEIEVRDFTELKYALLAKPNRILLDNFKLDDIKKAVNLFGSTIELEASGNIVKENALEYANTGVDFISMGSITHSVTSADLSMLFDYHV